MKKTFFFAGQSISSNLQGKYNTLIVEDNSDDLDRIQIELARFGINDPDIAMQYKSFTTMLNSCEYDAVSIDWELSKAQKGREALLLLTRQYPEVVKVVFTRHAEKRKDAMASGADEFIVKSEDLNMNKYSATMEKAVRLGCLRHIVKRLNMLGASELPSLPTGSLDIDEDIEKRVCESARQIVMRCKIEQQKDEGLRDLLIRRGWWHPLVFDTTFYIQLSWRDKIKQLLDYTEITLSEVAAILETEESIVKNFFDAEGGGDAVGQNLLESLDRLLSILGYALRLSAYDPELMQYFWRVKNFYENSIEKPPWEEVGLSTYLRVQGQQGLSKSLIWIRSH